LVVTHFIFCAAVVKHYVCNGLNASGSEGLDKRSQFILGAIIRIEIVQLGLSQQGGVGIMNV
jgi:hypothetical protein